jgi:cytochrome c-type biogenesis protein CcmH
MTRFIAALLAVFMFSSVLAIDNERAFEDPELQARYEKLISEVRCLKCQNQSIKDSNVFLASDLRREIRRLIAEGKTDPEIADFLVTRYGEFALYRPRASGKTLVLWIAPFFLVLFGGFALYRIVRHRMTLPIDDETDSHGATH